MGGPYLSAKWCSRRTLPVGFSSDFNSCPVNTLASGGGGAVAGAEGAGLHVRYTVDMTKQGTNPSC